MSQHIVLSVKNTTLEQLASQLYPDVKDLKFELYSRFIEMQRDRLTGIGWLKNLIGSYLTCFFTGFMAEKQSEESAGQGVSSASTMDDIVNVLSLYKGKRSASQYRGNNPRTAFMLQIAENIIINHEHAVEQLKNQNEKISIENHVIAFEQTKEWPYFGQGTYRGDNFHGIPNGHGRMETPTAIFEGNFSNGRLDGEKCRIEFICVGVYEGKVLNNQPDDENGGVLTLSNGTQLKGPFRNGYHETIEFVTLPDGTKYKGEWRAEKPHGKGVFQWQDGIEYSGPVLHGQPDNSANRAIKGRIKRPDGSDFTGDFTEGWHKEGSLLAKDENDHVIGVCRNCSYHNGQPHGPGEFQWRHGKMEKASVIFDHGHFKAKLKECANGGSYEGDFYQGREHGFGVKTWSKTEKYTGQFVKGIRRGKGELRWDNGAHYKGDFDKNRINGKGIMTWPNGDQYQGDFYNGNKHGNGVYISPDLYMFEGKYHEDRALGQGTLKLKWNKEKQDYDIKITGNWDGDYVMLKEPDNDLCCAITLAIMENPVKVTEMHVGKDPKTHKKTYVKNHFYFDRKSLMDWLQSGQTVNPINKQKLVLQWNHNVQDEQLEKNWSQALENAKIMTSAQLMAQLTSMPTDPKKKKSIDVFLKKYRKSRKQILHENGIWHKQN